jgi:hypothetical protein
MQCGLLDEKATDNTYLCGGVAWELFRGWGFRIEVSSKPWILTSCLVVALIGAYAAMGPLIPRITSI